MTPNTGLPPLPTELAFVAQFFGEWKESIDTKAQPVYTADQMREYAIAALALRPGGEPSISEWQRKAIAAGFEYWRASDAHGVTCRPAQAQRLLEELLGVEVDIEKTNGCETCDGFGMIGGPSYYAPDEGGVPCPDCTGPAGEPSDEQIDEAWSVAVRRNGTTQGTIRDVIRAVLALRPVGGADMPAEPSTEPLCPYCHGSGEGVGMEGRGPDTYEVSIICPKCNGYGVEGAEPSTGERDTMFMAAVSALAEISVALGIPDDEAACANGNDLILERIAELHAAQAPSPVAPSDDMNPIKEGWQISVTSGHSGYGVYAHMSEYPEEGAVLVAAIPDEKAEHWCALEHGGVFCRHCDAAAMQSRQAPSDALTAIIAERAAQDAQWGGPEHDDQHDSVDWMRFIERQLYSMVGYRDARRQRFVKIAALAVAAVESIDRRAILSTQGDRNG